MAFLIGGANSSAAEAYDIENSLRLDGSSSYLSFTYGSAGNRKTFTYSFWCKPSKVDTPLTFLNVFPGDGNKSEVTFSPRISAYDNSGGTVRINKQTNHLARDVSAWYHIVWSIDTTQSTAADRVKLWVNGVAVTSTSFGGWETDTLPDQNQDLHFMNAHLNHIGYNQSASGRYFSGYLADWYCIDGTAYDASYFGETDEDSGIWKPKEASVTFGSNGYKLEIKQTETSANASGIGADTSGEDNHFSVTNLAATDQTTDTPTNNFCTGNPLSNFYESAVYTEGNLTVQSDPAADNNAYTAMSANVALKAGKWYWEIHVDSISNETEGSSFGITPYITSSKTQWVGSQLYSYGYYYSGVLYNNSSSNSFGDSFTANDTLSFALDLTNNKLYAAKNGVWQNSGDPAAGSNGFTIASIATVAASTDTALPHVGGYQPSWSEQTSTDDSTSSWNFGNPPYAISSTQADDAGYGNFEYDVPAGFYAICTKNLAEYG